MITAENLIRPITKKQDHRKRRSASLQPKLDQVYVRERLEYHSGSMYWKPCERKDKAWNSRHAGKKAGTKATPSKPATVRIDDRLVSVQRLVWIYHFGIPPTGRMVMNTGQFGDTRIENLRLVTNQANG